MINVLYAANSNYFKYMITSIYSLIENNNSKINIHIIEEGFTPEQISMLDKIISMRGVSYKLYSVDKVRKYLDMFDIPLWRGTEVANARLFASEIITDVDKLLYLDSDTIVAGSIKELFNKKLDYPVNAVKELEVVPHLEDYLDTYHNSGVLLFDFNLWDKEDCIDRLYEEIDNYKDKLIYPDQDLLNLTLDESIGDLDFNYNITPILMEIIKHPFLSKRAYKFLDDDLYRKITLDLENPCIYHMLKYITVRPWEENKIHPFNSIFDEYYKKIYPEYEKEKNSFLMANFPFFPEINLVRKAISPRIIKKGTTKVMRKVLNRQEL